MFRIKTTLLLIIFSVMNYSCDDQDDALFFIGDSLVANWDLPRFFPNKNIKKQGVNGARIEDLRQWDVYLPSKGKTVVCLIGTNNLPSIKDNEIFSDEFKTSFIDSYIDCIEDFEADKVIAISLLPRTNHYNSSLINQEINRLNNELKNKLSAYDHVYFLDVFDSFIRDGKINEAYYTDGLHLNYYGYELISNLLRSSL